MCLHSEFYLDYVVIRICDVSRQIPGGINDEENTDARKDKVQ